MSDVTTLMSEQADRVRQRKEFVIEPTEQRRQRQENGGQIQK